MCEDQTSMISLFLAAQVSSICLTYLSVSFRVSSSSFFWSSSVSSTGLLHGLELIHGVAADVTDGDLGLLALLLDLLGPAARGAPRWVRERPGG